MSDLATLNPAGINKMLVELSGIEQALLGGEFDTDTENIRERAVFIKKLAAVQKTTRRLWIAAARVEAVCLHRLTELGGDRPTGLNNTVWEYIATLDREGLVAALDRIADTPLVTQARDWAYNNELGVAAESIASGTKELTGLTGYDREYAVRSVREVLDRALAGGVPFTVAEAAEQLIEQLGFSNSQPIQTAAELVVREALRETWVWGAHGDRELPDFIAVETPAGWVRLPWWAATITDLRWTATFRAKQAGELLAEADRLAALAARYEDLTPDHTTTLGKLTHSNGMLYETFRAGELLKGST